MTVSVPIVTLRKGIGSDEQQAVAPRTLTAAVSDANNVPLDTLLANINAQIGDVSTALADINSILEGTLGV